VLHPSLRIPAWVLLAIVVAAYGLRTVIRGGDARPDLPVDAIALAALLALLGLRWWLTRQGWEPPRDGGSPGEASETGPEDPS
jgi:hypothetical protein